jgi:hypothetical protein
MGANEGNELIKLGVIMIVLFVLVAGVVAVFTQVDMFGRNAVESVIVASAPADLRHYNGRYNGSGIHTLVAQGLPVFWGTNEITTMAQARASFSALRSYTVTWQEVGGIERLVVT